ncbi:unnamed protein product [Ceutorhynchus assimilis]|uniref:General transcription factor 3C polypeptide 1 n=1 Tax=Ceutorhynchus assimilis TaxID=467358 RepID=A0A9N9MTP6_9CUCU|nr:unnamed protein product [Ceutorhynchus assimilis]
MGKFIDPNLTAGPKKVIKRKLATKSASTSAPRAKKPRKDKFAGVEDATITDEPVQVKDNIEPVEAEFQDLEFEVVQSSSSGNEYLKLVRPVGDLFADDDLKARYDQHSRLDLIFTIFDEIALEGLDGITIQAFWQRIQKTLKCINLPSNLKELMWQVICLNKGVQFFELPEARDDLIVPSMDRDVNDVNFMQPIHFGGDIYKVEPAPKNSGLLGSCATLSTRVDISDVVRKMSLENAISEYGNKLVLVADSDLRKNAIVDKLADPNYEVIDVEYCVLERIGRARHFGEVTLGSASLAQALNMDTRSLHHYSKNLKKENFIMGQFCMVANIEHTKTGRLFHLRRFYHKRKTKYLIMMENVFQYMKKCPGYRAQYKDVRSLFNSNVQKFFKHQEFNKYIDTSIYVPYKEYYPGSTYKEYMTKGFSKERVVQLMQLKDPYVNIVACWGDIENQNNPDSSDDEDDDGDDAKEGRRIFNKDFIRDVYQFILSKGLEGAKTTEINKYFDTDRPGMRIILKKLVKRQLIVSRKKDIGKQTVYQYVACCLTGEAGLPSRESRIVQTGTSSALEKLKERQKQKIKSIASDRVYTAEQFASDRENQLLSLDLTPSSFITPQIPEIMCQYFIAQHLALPVIKEANTVLLKFCENSKPFKINLNLPPVSQNYSLNFENYFTNNQKDKILDYTSEIVLDKFKADKFSKVCLLRALIDNLKINSKDVIEFLDPKKSKVAEKRPLEKESKSNDRELGSELGVYMGWNPVLVLTEKDDEMGFLMEIYMSVPLIGDYMTGDITNYSSSAIEDSSDRVLSRIKIILKTIQQFEIFEELFKLLRIIYQEESRDGNDRKMDRRSLHRLLKRLADEGYVKIFQVILAGEDLKKTQVYVCHPDVTIEHAILQASVKQLKEKVFCYIKKSDEVVYQKPVPAKKPQKSPFIEHDVLASINEIKSLTVSNLKVQCSKTAAKYYGKRPKFAKISLIHELLFYLIYELNRNTKPLPKEEVAALFRSHQIRLTEAELENLPPVYCKEISWKTFIPPLPDHLGWDEGWALLCDVLLRFPISLITRCHAVNFISSELQETLHHPIKRYYLIRNVSPNIRMIIMYRRKFIHDMHSNLALLCYCGLLQFGPSVFHDKEKSFFYLNRKATIWDTRSSTPGYYEIEKKDYPKTLFYFHALDDVFKYWSTLVNVCLHTTLSSTKQIEGKTITLINSCAKPGLNKARACRNQNKVKQNDTGQIPGDNLGAGGLDSSLWAHKQRSWYFFARNKNTMTETLESLKLDKIANTTVAFDMLKVPKISNKYFLPTKKAIRKLKQVKRIGNPIIKRTIVPRKRKPLSEKRTGMDSVDRATLRRLNCLRYRPKWTEEEDRLLILLKIASQIITPDNPKQIIGYSVFRDILHILSPEYQNKTSRSIANRLRLLRRDVPFFVNAENLIPNLFKLTPMAKYFVPFRKFILNNQNTLAFQRKYKLSEIELQNAFVFLAYYFVTHRKEVEVALHGRNISIDYFNKENFDYYKENIEPFNTKLRLYLTPENEADIRQCTLTSTVHAALTHKKDNAVWSLQVYKIYQQFSEEVLRKSLLVMRNSRMINSTKEHGKTFFSPYRLSPQYVFSQSCTYWFTTMKKAYKTFLDLKYNPNSLDFSFDKMEETKFGQLHGINEVLSFMLPDFTLNFEIPEYHLILNPAIEDHSEVIDELAKRYQAKLRNDLKEAENQAQISSQTKEDSPEICEPIPGPSTSEPTTEDEIQFDDDEPLDLSITSNDMVTIDNLKHWISDCIDAERVRSPSPDLINLEVSHKKNEEGKIVEDEEMTVQAVQERVLDLEEIKEEMLKQYDSSKKRLVPYISDLTKLLSVNFEEFENEEAGYNLMKKHFVQQYPSLKTINADGLNAHYLSDYIESRSQLEEIWISLEKESYVGTPSNKGAALDELLEKGGTIEDVSLLSDEMLDYIESKGILGATGYELKEKFVSFTNTNSLELILKILTDHHILLKTGICAVTFVHYKFRDAWLTDTFNITPEQANMLRSKNNGKENRVTDDVIKALDINKWIKIKPLPWFTVDGILDKDMLKMWLTNVFSYCIENPKVTLMTLCDKFCFLKPVDVFYLADTLKKIGALGFRRHLVSVVDLYSEYDEADEYCEATMLDKFEEIYIETNNVGFLVLGSFLNCRKE